MMTVSQWHCAIVCAASFNAQDLSDKLSRKDLACLANVALTQTKVTSNEHPEL